MPSRQVSSGKGTFAYMGMASSAMAAYSLRRFGTIHGEDAVSCGGLALQMAGSIRDEYHISCQDSYSVEADVCALRAARASCD